MPAGDWGAGAFIVIERGELPEVAWGRSHVASVHYTVVLPSGARVHNGGQPPFRYAAVPTWSILVGGLALVQALAAYEGIPVHLNDRSQVLPDGTIVPTPPSWADSSGRFNLVV